MRVEMRRWLTYQKAGWDLVQMWHTLLVALIAQISMENKDPWKLMREPLPPRTKDADGATKNFEYKASCKLHDIS